MKRIMHLNRIKEFLFIIFLLTTIPKVHGQRYKFKEYPTFGAGLKLAPSYIVYDKKTSDIIDNNYLFMYELSFFYKRISLFGTFNSSYDYGNYIVKDINYLDKSLTTEQKLKLSLNSINLGYSIPLKGHFRIEPSLGKTNYFFKEEQDDGTSNVLIKVRGYNFGMECCKWFLKERNLCVFIKNQFYITNLYKVNSDFGKLAYNLSIGIGGKLAWIK